MTTRNWLDIGYLKDGNDRQKKAYRVLKETDILPILKEYDPIVVGTIPIRIDIPGSDIDIVCNVSGILSFRELVKRSFSKYELFSDTIRDDEQVYVASFIYDGLEIEIYATDKPSHLQNGYLHMIVEYRILCLKGEKFRAEIIRLKENGYKTEPAFGKLLGLENPYQDLLELGKLSDEGLKHL